jgi:malate dehydrogenase
MPVRIAILGASGAVGSMLAAHLLRGRLLEPEDCLILVDQGPPPAERRLLAVKIDLLDAFDDRRVQIEVVPDITDFEADIVVVAASATISAEIATRRDLALTNLPIFSRIAEQCAARLPRAVFIVISNPVELAVQILAGKIDRHRVIGMGAQQDSLRFARAVARDLGISRHHVRASVLGEHGLSMVPVWETVEVLTGDSRHTDLLAALRGKALQTPLTARVSQLMQEVNQLLARGLFAEAYRATCRALPDARIVVEPTITVRSIHSTPNATANATLQLVAATIAVDRRRLHGQVKLEGEALGIDGVCGLPVMLDHDGWRLWDLTCLNGYGCREAVIDSAASIGSFLDEIGVERARMNADMERAPVHQS